MPGVYTYGKVAFDETGARTIKPVAKIRGGDAKKYAAKIKINQWLIENVLAAWRKPFDPRKPETFPRIVAEYQTTSLSGMRAPRAPGGSWPAGGRQDRGSRALARVISSCTVSATSATRRFRPIRR